MLVNTKNGLVLSLMFTAVCVAGCDNLQSKRKAPEAKTSVAAAAVESAVFATDEKLPKDTLAVVGNWRLTVADFDERVKNIKQAVPSFDENSLETKKMLIDELIRQQLMVHEAREQRLNDTEEFRAALKDFENNILVQQLVVGLTKDIQVNDTEAKEYYDQNPTIFVAPLEKRASEIVVMSEAEAKDILVSLLQGADFAQTAKELSKGETSRDGGDLGFLNKPVFDQMESALATLNKGGLSGVFQGPTGYYIVKVTDVRGGETVAFDKIKEDLVKGLTAQKQQRIVLEKMAEVAKKVKVNVNGELLNAKTGE